MMDRMAARVTTTLYPDDRGYHSSGDQITLQYPLNTGCYAVTMCRREPRLPTPIGRTRIRAQFTVTPPRPPRIQSAVPRSKSRQHPDRVGPALRHIRARG